MQPMDVSKIKNFDKIVPLFVTGKLTPDIGDRAGHRAAHRRLRRGQGFGQVRQVPDPVDDADPDHLQRRHAGHPPRPRRPSDHALEGPARPRVQGQGVDPQHPVDRHHGCRHGRRVHGRDQVRRQGQHDQGGDRQDHRHHDRGQEGRPVPRLLEDLRRERQPDGVRRGRDPVDVVARRRRRARARASPAPTSRSRKATAPGAAGSASPSMSAGWSWKRPTNTSTGTCPAGSAPISTARATTAPCWTPPSST